MTCFIGLTGSIGSGKSTVLKILDSHDIPTLDLDQVGRELLNDSPVIQSLVKCFGSDILRTDKTIDRGNLATIAFSSKEKTELLNSIMHPAIQRYESDWRSKQTAPLCFIEASVLIEANAYQRMDAVIVVMADQELRKQRTLLRGTHDSAAFDLIVQRQCTDEKRIEVADYIIDNNKSASELSRSVSSLLTQLQTQL